MNKVALGPKSMQYCIQTKAWTKRLFLAVFALCEYNAYRAYNMSSNQMLFAGARTLKRDEWKWELSKALIYNPAVAVRVPRTVQAPDTDALQ